MGENGTKIVHKVIIHPDHHQYWLRDDVEPDVDTLYESGTGARPLVTVDSSGHMACIYTGMYGFDLPVIIEICPSTPALDLDQWEEVIEFSLLLGENAFIESILATDGNIALGLPAGQDQGQPASYRIRLHATGRDQAAEIEHLSAAQGQEIMERHLIQIWAAPPAPEEWLKELDAPTWEPDLAAPRTDFLIETTIGRYWLTDYSTDRHSATTAADKDEEMIVADPGGHMATIFTAHPNALVEVVLDISPEPPGLDGETWETVTEITIAFTGPDIGCNFGAGQSSPTNYQELPADEDQTRTYKVRVSTTRLPQTPHSPEARTPNPTERHKIQIWPINSSASRQARGGTGA